MPRFLKNQKVPCHPHETLSPTWFIWVCTEGKGGNWLRCAPEFFWQSDTLHFTKQKHFSWKCLIFWFRTFLIPVRCSLIYFIKSKCQFGEDMSTLFKNLKTRPIFQYLKDITHFFRINPIRRYFLRRRLLFVTNCPIKSISSGSFFISKFRLCRFALYSVKPAKPMSFRCRPKKPCRAQGFRHNITRN